MEPVTLDKKADSAYGPASATGPRKELLHVQLPSLTVRFKNPDRVVPVVGDPLLEEIERFSAADSRWRNIIEMAAARLSPGAQRTLGVALSGLQAGRAPRILSFDFETDSPEAVIRETSQMEPRILTGLGLLTSERLGLTRDEVHQVLGTVSAIHRLLRIAKTRP